MATIEERIKSLGNYFDKMQTEYVEGEMFAYVIVNFPAGWIISDDIQEKYDVDVVKSNEGVGQYYFVGKLSIGFEKIFDAIDYCIAKMKDAIERTNLLKQKTHELTEIFGNEEITIEQLRSLKFSYDSVSPLKLMENKKSEDNESTEDNNKKKGKNK